MADSTIRVNIIGDARKLQGALKDSESKLGAFSRTAVVAGAAFAGAFAVDKVLDFAQTALSESDRVGDALDRLEGQLSGPLAAAIDSTASGFTNLGQSRQDILELSAGFTDMATALGIGKDDIAAWATEAAAIAAALELQGIGTAASNIDLIGKAAGGSEKAMRALGLNISQAEVESRALNDTGKATADQLTESEKAAAAYVIIMDELRKRTGDLTESSGDLEQSQAELQAKWETLTGKIGEGLEGPLNDLLAWIIQGIEGWEVFAQKIDLVRSELRRLLGPVFAVTDAVANLIGLIDDLLRADDQLFRNGQPSNLGGGATDYNPGGQFNPTSSSVTVNIQSADTDMIEQTVQKALKGYQGANGFSYPDHL